ncbi:hypothetical protein ACFQ48_17910 [Hymenobacter caeli]|uniref:Uncharacterized protein n=1 Tax=Hymenobacter caeli TaxID=2735894 RepID=A0ABX2FVC6_9BACT|nr:hypothetical protein [Hymenobacter caeli]NRT20917.1 hypothetical protein [Hymenobacter caeli]
MRYALLLLLTLAMSLLAPGHRWRAGPARGRPAGRVVVVVRKPGWAAGQVKTVRRVAPAVPL